MFHGDTEDERPATGLLQWLGSVCSLPEHVTVSGRAGCRVIRWESHFIRCPYSLQGKVPEPVFSLSLNLAGIIINLIVIVMLVIITAVAPVLVVVSAMMIIIIIIIIIVIMSRTIMRWWMRRLLPSSLVWSTENARIGHRRGLGTAAQRGNSEMAGR